MCGCVMIEVYFQNTLLLFHVPVYLIYKKKKKNLLRFQVHCETKGMLFDKGAVLLASGWSCG